MARTNVVKKRTITAKDESKLVKAKEEFQAGKFKSIKAAATAHNVQYFTLRRCILGLTLFQPMATSSQVRLEDLNQVPTTTQGSSDFYSNLGPGSGSTTSFTYFTAVCKKVDTTRFGNEKNTQEPNLRVLPCWAIPH
jgi:hypothetical protein